MDKNGKIFGKISIIDLLLLIIVLAVIIGAIYRFTSPTTAVAQGDATIAFTVRIEGVRDFTLGHYQEGLRVYDRMSGQYIGEISNVRYEPHYQTAVTLDGNVIFSPQPQRLTLFIEVTSQNGRITNQHIFAEGSFEVNAGSTILMNTRYVQVQGNIDSVDIQ